MNILGIILLVAGTCVVVIYLFTILYDSYHKHKEDKIKNMRGFSSVFTATVFLYCGLYWLTFVYQPQIYTKAEDIYSEYESTVTETTKVSKYKAKCRVKVWTNVQLTAGLDDEFIKDFNAPCNEIPDQIDEWISKASGYIRP